MLDATPAAALPDVRQARESGLVASAFPRRTTRRNWRPRFALAAQFDRKVIVERGIEGRELECSVLGNEAPIASLPCEILPSPRVLRLRGQVSAGSGARPRCPRSCRRSRPKNCGGWPWNATARWSARAWRASISSWRRRPDRLYINEINTIPGFTSISMYPEDVGAQRHPVRDLLDQLIELALDRHKRKTADAVREIIGLWRAAQFEDFRLPMMIRFAAALLLAAATLPAQDDLDKPLRSFIDAFATASSNAADPINAESLLRRRDPTAAQPPGPAQRLFR